MIALRFSPSLYEGIHLHGLNPVSITHKQKDGERWIKRDENNQQKAFYYVLSAKAAAEASKADPVQAGLDFETGSNEEWHDGDPFWSDNPVTW